MKRILAVTLCLVLSLGATLASAEALNGRKALFPMGGASLHGGSAALELLASDADQTSASGEASSVPGDYGYDTLDDGSVEITSYDGADTELVIPSTLDGRPVTAIGKGTFAMRFKLTRVTLPEGLSSIGESAFQGCIGLTDVTLPDSVTTIGEHAFSECRCLEKVTLPKGLEEIEGGAFAYCESLVNVVIPDSVTYLGYGAFNGCASLTSVTLPKEITNINPHMFEGCSSLSSIVIPNRVQRIEYLAFKDCTSLTSVTIPDSVTEISSAFEDCDNAVFTVGRESCAEQYCVENGYTYIYAEDASKAQ